MTNIVISISIAIAFLACCAIIVLYKIIRTRAAQHAQEILAIRTEYSKHTTKNMSTQRAVIKGQLAEQFYPLTDRCVYHPSDMRFMGDFCDYIVIDGYTKCKDENDNYINKIVFIEIKTGKAQLSRHQKLIRNAIQEGRITWETVQLD